MHLIQKKILYVEIYLVKKVDRESLQLICQIISHVKGHQLTSEHIYVIVYLPLVAENN